MRVLDVAEISSPSFKSAVTGGSPMPREDHITFETINDFRGNLQIKRCFSRKFLKC